MYTLTDRGNNITYYTAAGWGWESGVEGRPAIELSNQN